MEAFGQISVVIVNWNAGNQLRECIDSIIQHGNGLVAQTIVVDNGSVDGSDDSIEGLSNVDLIRTGENLGFGRACNLGAEQATGDYLLFLNPDATIYANTLAKVLAFMEDAPNVKVGICGVQLKDEDNVVSRSCARFPSAFRFVAHAVGVDRFLPKLGHRMVEWDHASTRQVDHVIGAFFLVRKCLFEELQGFDEQFFVYLEDLDFSRRANSLGWSSAYLADTQAFHSGGGTSQQVKARRLFYSLRSRILYSFKHFSLFGAIGVLLMTLFVEPLSRSIQAICRFSFVSFKETCAAYRMLFCWLPSWIAKGVTR